MMMRKFCEFTRGKQTTSTGRRITKDNGLTHLGEIPRVCGRFARVGGGFSPTYTPFTRWSKHEAYVFNIHIHDVCFKFASCLLHHVNGLLANMQRLLCCSAESRTATGHCASRFVVRWPAVTRHWRQIWRHTPGRDVIVRSVRWRRRRITEHVLLDRWRHRRTDCR